MQNSIIEHSGIVTEISSNCVKVTIGSVSACSACHAKGACSASDMQDKVIEAKLPDWEVKIGESINVQIGRSLSYLALFLGYIFPLILIIVTLIVTTILGYSELITGGLSLGILVPYYFILFLFGKKLKKTYSFTIKKQL